MAHLRYINSAGIIRLGMNSVHKRRVIMPEVLSTPRKPLKLVYKVQLHWSFS